MIIIKTCYLKINKQKDFSRLILISLLTIDLSSSKQTAIVSGKDIFCCCEYDI
jgi:hypothetical protein